MRKNSKHKNCLRRGMAAFCLSAVLSAGSFSFAVPVYAEGYGTLEEAIPESVTIEQGCCLGSVALPDSAFGSLSWAYPDYVPQEYVEECTAWLYPADPDQVNWMDGWDSDEGALKVMITVVLHEEASYEGSAEEAYAEEEYPQENYEEQLPETASSPSEEDGAPSSEGTPEDGDAGMIVEEGGQVPDPAVDEGSDVPAGQADPADGSEAVVKDAADGSETVVKDTADGSGAVTEDPGNVPEGQTENTDVPDNTGSTDDPEQPEDPETPDNAENTEPEPSIFDTDMSDAADRTGDAGDPAGMTEQQILDAAARNHLSNGIYVSGPNLPWYVMFTATEDNEHSFSIASGAKVFKAFRFELWDLQANKPYTIPDGDYVSVTIPVTAGYNYTVEHLLNNGATETIIPSVNGGSLVFSTNSFSSYGIAGSETVVGGEITDENYNNPPKNDQNQPTPVPTQAPAQQAVTNTPAPQQNAQNAEQPPVVPQGVRTGDDTNITPLVVLGICAAAVIIAAVILLLIKRRKK